MGGPTGPKTARPGGWTDHKSNRSIKKKKEFLRLRVVSRRSFSTPGETFQGAVANAMSVFRAIWKSSIDATKKAIAGNFDDMIPPNEISLFNFNTKEDIRGWHLNSDSEYGGMSSASLEIKDSENKQTGVFSGSLSMGQIEGARWRMNRSGFCAMRSKKVGGFIDLDAYDTIAMRLRGDGRSYISTIYTENWVNSPAQMEDNSWQAFIFPPKDEWFLSQTRLDRYMPTWRGNVIDADLEMNPSRIVGMALSVNANALGPISGFGSFKLEVDWIKAMRCDPH